MSSHRRDEHALQAQSDAVRVVSARSGLVAVGGIVSLLLLLRWLRNR
ncbi:hypothetical protein SAMN05216553_11062 [Lentzea fradiae]|uniref:Uncharacterized protein n=1 Tax=Lentzea fradiae TaxID=200378 RepID=A0A1G7VZN5_9PSEU|nr:hypothetical protein [Lentzea fradiae]SDG65235.1 hypothetical protein SAMN05216553_11062 [Lentzea fradiae]